MKPYIKRTFNHSVPYIKMKPPVGTEHSKAAYPNINVTLKISMCMVFVVVSISTHSLIF